MGKQHHILRITTLFMCLLISISTIAQNIVVKGTIHDPDGLPIVYASVQAMATKTLVNSDAKGAFTLEAPKGTKLRISYIGYKTLLVDVAPEVNVTLEDNSTLQQAVVIGYGVAKKTDLTGSVTSIKPDTKNKGLVVNAQDMLQGKVAGVTVTGNDGTPGGGANIRIRGGSSLNASNAPLIVIDGVALDNNGAQGLANPLSMVNPQDIATYSVLKDASATAIYGSRGSNGVIIITTKKGHKGQSMKVSYNGSMSINQKKKTLDVMNGDEYREFIQRVYAPDAPYAMQGEKQAQSAAEAINALGTHNTNWQNEIYRTAIGHDHNLTFCGALKWMPYRLSAGYTDQNGILRTSSFKRYTASMNLNPTFFDDHLTVNLSAKGMYARNHFADGGAVSAAANMDPTQAVRDYDATFDNYNNYFTWRKSGADLKDPSYPTMYNPLATPNPVAMLDLRDDRSRVRSFIGNAEVNYKIHGLEDLQLHMNLGADITKGTQNTDVDPAAPQAFYFGSTGSSFSLKRNFSFNTYAQYLHDFGEAHHFDIMAGYEWQHFWHKNRSEYWGTYRDTNSDPEKAGQALPHLPSVYKSENYLVSFFGRANYTLLDRYLFTATLRNDGSSRFKDHWSLFPSVAFAWKVKNEDFLKQNDFISDLKLRLGYGQTGQQDGIGDYNYFRLYDRSSGTQNYYPIYGEGELDRPIAFNEDLTWETTSTYNAGIDLGIVDNRLHASLDYYYRKTTDLLNLVFVPAGSNFRNKIMSNIGSLENQGFELALDWKAIRNEDWYWTISANATYNKNKITELSQEKDKDFFVETGGIKSGTGNNIQAQAVGHAANSFRVFQQVYDENGLPLEGVYVDRNGDGVITDADRYLYKSPMAPWTFGLSSRLEYKKWDLGMSFRANVGNYVYNDIEAGSSNMNLNQIWSDSYKFLSNRPKDVIDRNFQSYNSVLSDYYVQNASFLKLDNITLGYSFNHILRHNNYDGINGRIYGSVSNVFCITKYKGIDPEVFNGIDGGIYPRPISFIMGLSLNF